MLKTQKTKKTHVKISCANLCHNVNRDMKRGRINCGN